ncbi:hypothetical protein [Endozoicomonas sp. 4G]|uniref:hypothetical protein n=1 Tax=Endozoicomonas sp. 4G TaxID=2872754 RepID=UPI00207880F3|nr:hypothetical protein [Endozoicomonas sp. 4G]
MKLIAYFLPLYLISTVLYSDEHCLICKKYLADKDKKALVCQHTFHQVCYDVLAEHEHFADCPKCSGFIDQPCNGALHAVRMFTTNEVIHSLIVSNQETRSELQRVRDELQRQRQRQNIQFDNVTATLFSIFAFGIIVLYCVGK